MRIVFAVIAGIFTFRRGNYLIGVECPKSHGVEHLKKLAEVLDGNLLKAQPPNVEIRKKSEL